MDGTQKIAAGVFEIADQAGRCRQGFRAVKGVYWRRLRMFPDSWRSTPAALQTGLQVLS